MRASLKQRLEREENATDLGRSPSVKKWQDIAKCQGPRLVFLPESDINRGNAILGMYRRGSLAPHFYQLFD
jgi:hypothetical protein